MNITKIDYLSYAENAKKVSEGQLKYKPDLPVSFLEHTLPILSSIPLVYNEANLIATKDTILQLKETTELKTPNGIMTGINIMRLVMFLYLCRRGDLIHGSQNKTPRLASLTPLFMYAHKLYNNIPYSSWDKTDPQIAVALGKSLAPILEVKELPEGYNVNETRKLALTYKTGAKQGQQAPITGYKCNIRRIGDIDIPNIAMMMVLQLWIANAALRDTSSMILDPVNWDEVPHPLDTTLETSSKPRIEIPGDISWN